MEVRRILGKTIGARSERKWMGVSFALVVAGCLSATLSSCGEDIEPLVIARCQSDAACEDGEVCVDGECIPRDSVSCAEIDGGMAILQPGPPLLDFGHTGSGTSYRPLVLRNIGDCTLTVFEAYFESEGESPFECPFCAPTRFPIELFPFRDHELKVYFTPEDVGMYEDMLVLLSDDAEYNEIQVPVRARFNGIPEASVVPDEIDFDYAPVGRTIARTLQITNRGNGTAPLIISRLEIQTATNTSFSIDPEELDNPIELVPLGVNRNASYTVNLRYHPKEIENHTGDLVIHTNMPVNNTVHVPLYGSSQTPASISVSPEALQFGPVPIGQSTALPLTIINEGGTPLRVTYKWGGTGLSTDFSALPAILAPIPPGQYTELQVFVTATAPTEITGMLILESNDPVHPSITVPVSAEGQDVIGAQVIKIDMNFENGSDGTFDDDFRNVDMTLENPFGLVCNKQYPNPTNWSGFGNPSWIGFGPKEEPERVVLPDAQQDGTYRVLLNYIEDCSSVPSALVAAVLGITVEALIAYFTGGVTTGIVGSALSDAIDGLCLNHSSSSVTLTVYINGQIVAEVPATVSTKGDYIYALDLVRSGGVFTVQ